MANLLLGRNQFGDPRNADRLLAPEKADALLSEWVSNERLRLHMRQVAALMKAWALEREKTDPYNAGKWELAGLLHDADWEKYPDQHCRIIIEKLESEGVDPDVIHCIASHGPGYFGVEPVNKMDKMIYAFDELSGFIHAVALVRPTRYVGMEVKSVIKKLRTPSFAAQISRADIEDALSRIEVTLEELIGFIIPVQQEVQ